jgi:hypothetical protein
MESNKLIREEDDEEDKVEELKIIETVKAIRGKNEKGQKILNNFTLI